MPPITPINDNEFTRVPMPVAIANGKRIRHNNWGLAHISIRCDDTPQWVTPVVETFRNRDVSYTIKRREMRESKTGRLFVIIEHEHDAIIK